METILLIFIIFVIFFILYKRRQSFTALSPENQSVLNLTIAALKAAQTPKLVAEIMSAAIQVSPDPEMSGEITTGAIKHSIEISGFNATTGADIMEIVIPAASSPEHAKSIIKAAILSYTPFNIEFVKNIITKAMTGTLNPEIGVAIILGALAASPPQFKSVVISAAIEEASTETMVEDMTIAIIKSTPDSNLKQQFGDAAIQGSADEAFSAAVRTAIIKAKTMPNISTIKKTEDEIEQDTSTLLMDKEFDDIQPKLPPKTSPATPITMEEAFKKFNNPDTRPLSTRSPAATGPVKQPVKPMTMEEASYRMNNPNKQPVIQATGPNKQATGPVKQPVKQATGPNKLKF